MRRAIGKILHLICLLSLLTASIPVGATEMVCIVPHRGAIAMARCGMPCCAHPAKILAPCCRHKEHLVACDQQTAAPKCHSQTGCRCELRIYAASSLTIAPLHRIASLFAQPLALLPSSGELPRIELVSLLVPAVYFTDSSPPPRPPCLQRFSRAPPVS